MQLKRIVYHLAARNDGNVLSVSCQVSLADLKDRIRRIQHAVLLARINTDGQRADIIQALFNDLPQLNRIGCCAHRHVNKRGIERHILHCIVGRAAVAGQSSIVGNNANRQVGITYVRAHLLERTHAHKGHHADDKRDIAVVRQSCRNANDILLRNTGVDKTVRVLGLEVLAAKADIRREKPYALILPAKLCNRISYHRSCGVIFIECIRLFHL